MGCGCLPLASEMLSWRGEFQRESGGGKQLTVLRTRAAPLPSFDAASLMHSLSSRQREQELLAMQKLLRWFVECGIYPYFKKALAELEESAEFRGFLWDSGELCEGYCDGGRIVKRAKLR